MKNQNSYILYVSEDCKWCAMAKALLDSYDAVYELRFERCSEWSTYPAIYRSRNNAPPELIGGFRELSTLSTKEDL
jgi:hypothetical protein